MTLIPFIIFFIYFIYFKSFKLSPLYTIKLLYAAIPFILVFLNIR